MQFYVVHFMSYIFLRLLSDRADGRLFQTAASRLIEFKPIRLMSAPAPVSAFSVSQGDVEALVR